MNHQIKLRVWENGVLDSVEIKESITTLLQFIGLKDKKDKEIYEGDILRWYHDSVSHSIVKVEYLCDEDHNGFYIVDGDYKRELTGHIVGKTEVIGNIFDNPELIKP